MTTKLISGNPELLQYACKSMHITVLGGIKLTGLDRLRVTLKVVSTGDSSNAFRHNLDLYNSIQSTQVIERLADFLDLTRWRTRVACAFNLNMKCVQQSWAIRPHETQAQVK
ncbi:MAG: hypothetical protein K9G42_06060 [Pedobacter sp.]|nr:hypothetical protein [Pedobacter sp.]